MNLSTFLVALVVFGLVALIVVRQIRAKKSGKGGCSCGCEGCANRGGCHPHN